MYTPSCDDEKEKDTLNPSWIFGVERYHNIHSNQTREPIPTILIHYIYINKYSYIEKIVTEEEGLDIDDVSGCSILSKENVLKKIQSKKMLTPVSKYKLMDILSFVVDISPDHLQDFYTSETSDGSFLKVLPIFNDIVVNPSIFIFHNINRLYFIFQEVDLSLEHRTTLRSILKRDDVPPNNNLTKKVRMADPHSLEKLKLRKPGVRSTRRARNFRA